MNSVPVTVNSGPPLGIGFAAMFAQGSDTLQPSGWPKAMDALRLWDDGTRLGVIAPAEGVFNWASMDALVEMALAAGKQIIYTLGSTPAWMAMPVAGAPKGAYDATSNCPPNLALLAPVIVAIATRYKGKIAYYEGWNEWNSSGFWCGTLAEQAAVHALYYSTIKSIDPAALVTFPTPCWSDQQPYPTVDVAIKALLNAGCPGDIVTFHGYLAKGLPGDAIGATIAAVRGVMAAAGNTSPLWNTEGGFSGSAGGGAGMTTAQQRQWTLDYFMANFSGGVSLVGWYQWSNLTHNPGITDATGATLTPAGQAMVDLYAALKAIGVTLTQEPILLSSPPASAVPTAPILLGAKVKIASTLIAERMF